MFESPNTLPLWLLEHHLRVQERPATIAPKAYALINLTNKKNIKLHIKPPHLESLKVSKESSVTRRHTVLFNKNMRR